MRVCTRCDVEQPLDSFHKGAAYKHGRRTWCKTCMAVYKKQYKEANKEKLLAQQRAYDAAKNPERREYFRQWHLANKERNNAQRAKYRKNNLALHAAKEARRRFSKACRTPVWLTDDDYWLISQAYELAALRTAFFGFEWHVDHVLPLQGKTVSGFHVPTNLQVIPAEMNYVKSNRFEVAS